MQPLARPAAWAPLSRQLTRLVSPTSAGSGTRCSLGHLTLWNPRPTQTLPNGSACLFSTSSALRVQPPKSPDSKPDVEEKDAAAKPLASHLPHEKEGEAVGATDATKRSSDMPSVESLLNPPKTDTSASPSPSSTSSPTSDASSSSSNSSASPSDTSATNKDSDPAPSTSSASASSSSADATSTSTSTSSSSSSSPPTLSTSLPRLLDTLQARLLTASRTLNDLTGYTAIENIKSQNSALETSLSEAHDTLRAARAAYKTATAKHASTQREVTTLLARKESWAPPDLERFTDLYRRDHSLEQEVAQASERLSDAESHEQRLSQELVSGMMRRYHEEQIWSDRIRRASTWGTWGLMGVNVVLFVLLQFVAEPWRRRRLVRAVVEEEKGVLESVREELAVVKGALAKAVGGEGREAAPEGVVDGAPATIEAAGATAESRDFVTPEAALPPESSDLAASTPGRSWREFLGDPNLWRDGAADLYSDRRTNLCMRDASILALQSAAAGAAVAASVAVLVLKRA